MAAFTAGVAAMFRDPNMAVDADYLPKNGTLQSVRVLLSRPDASMGWQDAKIVLPTFIAEVQVAEVAEAQAGDVISIGAESYRVQGKPMRDPDQLTWRMEAVKV